MLLAISNFAGSFVNKFGPRDPQHMLADPATVAFAYVGIVGESLCIRTCMILPSQKVMHLVAFVSQTAVLDNTVHSTSEVRISPLRQPGSSICCPPLRINSGKIALAFDAMYSHSNALVLWKLNCLFMLQV